MDPVGCIQPFKPYERWLPLYGSQIHRRNGPGKRLRRNWNSGWIGLGCTPRESDASWLSPSALKQISVASSEGVRVRGGGGGRRYLVRKEKQGERGGWEERRVEGRDEEKGGGGGEGRRGEEGEGEEGGEGEGKGGGKGGEERGGEG